MNCPGTALMLYPPLADRVGMLSWIAWGLVAWNALLTGFMLYVAFYAKRKVDDAARGFADALRRSLLGNGKEAVE